jgi:hypothetical protein
MTIHLHKDRLVSEILQEFNAEYPFLKIELFAQKHGFRQASPGKEKLRHHLALKEVAGDLVEQDIELPHTMSVYQLEQLFRQLLGIHVQVLRKSGNLWLETTITDSWTLKQQNDHGKEISLPALIPVIYPQKAADNQ